MVAVQVLLMNYFLLGLHSDKQLANDVVPSDDIGTCSIGCGQCSAVNGCMVCKSPFVLILRTQNSLQLGYCARSCPKGFYNKYKGLDGIGGMCFRCDIEGCRQCSSQTVCRRCNSGYTLERHLCVRRCPKGFRYDEPCAKCLKIRKEKQSKYSLGCTKYSKLNGCLKCKPPFMLILKRDGFLQKGHCSRCCPKSSYSSDGEVCLGPSEARNNTLLTIYTPQPKRIDNSTNLSRKEKRKRKRKKKRRRKQRERRKKKKRQRNRKKRRKHRIRHCHNRRKRKWSKPSNSTALSTVVNQ